MMVKQSIVLSIIIFSKRHPRIRGHIQFLSQGCFKDAIDCQDAPSASLVFA